MKELRLKTIEKAALILTLLLFFAAVGLSISARSQRLSTEIPITTPTPPPPTETAQAETLVNINTAGIDELCTLPGIGPAIAQRIIDYRTAHGPFTAPADIIDVSGIGFATFEKFKDLITV